MRLIDADALIEQLKEGYCADCEMRDDALCNGCRIDAAINGFDHAPNVDAIPVDWMLQRMNETASGEGLNVELNNALFVVGVEWERWKKGEVE